MADTAYERVLCVKNEVLVYRIPPRPSNRGYRADEWQLSNPDWTGRLRVVSKGKELFLKLEDRNSGELFAQCPVDAFPGIAVEPVMDSSRYFVLRIKDEGGRSAFIGIGFHDRSDSFDLNVSIQDHFKWLKQEADEVQNAKALDSAPKLDLGFKEGQTITLNIGSKKEGKARPKAGGKAGGLGFLPPPPGGSGKIAPPSGAAKPSQPPPPAFQAPAQSSTSQPSEAGGGAGVDSLFDLGGAPTPPTSTEDWGGFTSASRPPAESSSNNTSSGGDWVQF